MVDLIVYIFILYCIFKAFGVLFSMAGGCIVSIVKFLVAMFIIVLIGCMLGGA
jgi:hypothetical protein